MVSELPWDARTGTLKREMAGGMMNPACKHAMEAALQLKHIHGAHITALTMGPPMAEEVLREAVAMGADRGILLTDKRLAGADTLITSYTLARAIEAVCPHFDLVLCGCSAADSETAQVGPQLAEELGVPGVAYVEQLSIQQGAVVRMQRVADDFLETLEMKLPGLVTLTTSKYAPRYVPLSGVQDAFESGEILTLDADGLGLDPNVVGLKGSPTQILDVFSPTTGKKNIVLKGAPKKIVEQLLEKFDDRIGGAAGKDLKVDEQG